MHLIERACGALGMVIVAPFALVSIPILLPALIVSSTLAIRRFWRLRAGDVLGTSFVVLHPPNKGSEFRLVELCNGYPCVLHVWKNVSDAQSFLFRILPESFTDAVCNPMRCTRRQSMFKVAELLAEPRSYIVVHDSVYSNKVERFWRELTEFELLRPVRLIQRAWRDHAVRRRQAAAYVITRAALHFLYRPKGKGYEAALRRWRHGTEASMHHMDVRV